MTTIRRRPKPAPKPRWLTMEQVAEINGISIKSVRRYIDQGRLPAYRVGPRNIRIDATDAYNLAVPVD